MSRMRERRRPVRYDDEEMSEPESIDLDSVSPEQGTMAKTPTTKGDAGQEASQDGSKKKTLTRLVKVKEDDTREVSDEIEDSEEVPSDDIAEHSDDMEVVDRPDQKKRKRKLASIMGDKAKSSKKKAVATVAEQLNMTGAILRYAHPNVSNVKEKDSGGNEQEAKAKSATKEEPQEGRRPRRAAAAAVNYNEEFISSQACVFPTKRSAPKPKGKEPGEEPKAGKKVVIPDSEDECEEIVAEMCSVGDKTADKKDSDACRRSARQHNRVSYAEAGEFAMEVEDNEAPARTLRKQAMAALSKRKEQEDGAKTKQKKVTDLETFTFRRGAAKQKDDDVARSEDEEEGARGRGNRRALRERAGRNVARNGRGRARRSSPEIVDSSGSEEEKPRKKKPAKHTSPTRKSERARKAVMASLAEHESEDEPDPDEETGDDEDDDDAEEEGASEEEEGEGAGEDDALDGRVEKILAPAKGSIDVDDRHFVVKFHDMSYRAAKAVSESVLMHHCPQLLRNYLVKGGDGSEDEPFPPEYATIERIILERQRRSGLEYLVKWRGLEYGQSTWERVEDLADDQDAVERFEIAHQKPAPDRKDRKEVEELEFKTGRTLREYQLVGVQWLEQNFRRRKSCMLGDEMGLGKTFQTVAMLETLRRKHLHNGLFLVIAPVSTLGHWQREIESLTDLFCVVYKGDADDRETIRDTEMTAAKGGRNRRFHVLLTSFELLVKDAQYLTKGISWRYVVVDEAHRLKSRTSKASKVIQDLDLEKGQLLLLTGTPIQNNTSELFALLSLLDPDEYASEDDFMGKYGNIKDSERVRELQAMLKPILLRRKKEDVEKSIPQKEEVIIWVELTQSQRSYYKAVYEGQIGTLLKGVKRGNLPNMRNVAMELRKLCNHPFLSNSVADNMIECRRWEARGQLDHLSDDAIRTQLLQQGSGKMVLLNKLLPKLKEGGHKVLIFSQFKIMLDLLEEYVMDKGYPFERIDGDITGSGRQAAMDRFQAEGSDSFIFLLSTRAGGLGITLTAADTCIIYDSDWNPQNDLQAMARCHRIGQTKDVKVYRLVTKNTYEEQLFSAASRKYGLDEAILGGNMGEQRDPEQGKDIENLLLKGAYHCLQDEAAEQAAAKFGEEDIEQILMQRTETRQVGGTGKSSFAEATFAPVEEQMKWEEMLPEAVAREREREEAAARALVEGVKQPRRRNKVNYTEKVAYESSGSEDDFDGADDTRPARKTSPKEKETGWTDVELKRLEDKLVCLGEGRWGEIQNEARLSAKPLPEVAAVCTAVIKLCKHVVATPPPVLAAQAPNPKPLTPIATLSPPTATNAAQAAKPTPGSAQTPQPAGVSASPGLVAPVLTPAAPPLVPFKSALELDVPADVRKAFEGGKFRERITKNAPRYLQMLHERTALADAVADRDCLTKWLKTNAAYTPGKNKLPQWWDWQCDKDLMVGAHRHGSKAFRTVAEDSAFIFQSLLAISDPNPDFTTSPTLLPGSLSPGAGPSLLPQSPSLLPPGLAIPGPFAPRFLTREFPSDQILSTRLKKLLGVYPSKEEIAETKARRALKAEERAQARAADEARARARAEQGALSTENVPGCSVEDSGDTRAPPLAALQKKLEAERRREKAERRAKRKLLQKEAEARAAAAADVALKEMRRSAQKPFWEAPVPNVGQESAHQLEAETDVKIRGSPKQGEKRDRPADGAGKVPASPVLSACLALGSPERRKLAVGNGRVGGESSLPLRPALTPSALNGVAQSPGGSTGHPKTGRPKSKTPSKGTPGVPAAKERSSALNGAAQPRGGPTGQPKADGPKSKTPSKGTPGGPAAREGSSTPVKQSKSGNGGVSRSAALAQVLNKQGAPIRTSSEGGSVEMVLSGDYEKARKKKRQLEEVKGNGSPAVNKTGGVAKKAKVQPTADKENQVVSKKKKKHPFEPAGVKQQTLMSFMKKSPAVARVN